MAVEKKVVRSHFEKKEAVSSRVEQNNKPEKSLEKEFLTSEKPLDDLESSPVIKAVLPNNSQLAVSFQQRRAKAIDQILAEGLNDVFLSLDSSEQKVFKIKGEETVLKINELLVKGKVKVNKIIDLIRKWLSFVPGLNKFFLEQEIKIKADKILKIKDKL